VVRLAEKAGRVRFPARVASPRREVEESSCKGDGKDHGPDEFHNSTICFLFSDFSIIHG